MGCRAAAFAEYFVYFEGQALPLAEAFDRLVVMSGPMSVHDEADYAWLVPEKRLIAQYLETGWFLLGVRLGSQLLAESLGREAYSSLPSVLSYVGCNSSATLCASRTLRPSQIAWTPFPSSARARMSSS